MKKFCQDFERYLAGLLLMVIALFVFAQVISRYVIHLSISYTEELAQHLFIWCMMLGAAAAAKRKAHLGLKLLSRSRRPWIRKALAIVSLVLVPAFLLAVIVSGVQIVWLQIETGQRSPGLGWPIGWVGLAYPLGAALILIRFVRARRKELGGEEEPDGD